MLHVGLDLSRRRVDVCLISEQGELKSVRTGGLTCKGPWRERLVSDR